MIKVEVTVDTDIFDELNKALLTSGDRFARQYGIELQNLRARTLNRLNQMPPPSKRGSFARFATKKQKAYVMAKLRKRGTIPYVRTGAFVDAWKAEYDATSHGGLFTVFNTAKNNKGDFIEQYITGFNQQGFHQDTGWYQSQNILADVLVEAEDILINLWGRILEI